MGPQILNDNPTGVTIVWYFSDNSPLVGRPPKPNVPIENVTKTFSRYATKLMKLNLLKERLLSPLPVVADDSGTVIATDADLGGCVSAMIRVILMGWMRLPAVESLFWFFLASSIGLV